MLSNYVNNIKASPFPYYVYNVVYIMIIIVLMKSNYESQLHYTHIHAKRLIKDCNLVKMLNTQTS